MPRPRLLAIATSLTAVAVAAVALAAAPQRITPKGVGGVKLGATFKALRAKGLVGPLRRGCELGGPNTRGAALRPPLRGSVDFSLSSPRKATNITVTRGAKARGVGIGATIAQIKRAFPKARVDHSTDSTFLLTLVRVPKGGGGRLHFGVSTKTKRVTVIGVPYIAFCE